MDKTGYYRFREKIYQKIGGKEAVNFYHYHIRLMRQAVKCCYYHYKEYESITQTIQHLSAYVSGENLLENWKKEYPCGNNPIIGTLPQGR